jgi:putative membrane protein
MDRADSPLDDAKNVGRGLLMGAADIVPGVSGGTVALILGIYERLVAAISHVDLELVGHLRAGRIQGAIDHADLRFLAALLVGIGTGIVSLASLMHHLLEHEMAATFGLFFGLILASSWLVARLIERWTVLEVVAAVLGGVFAFWLTGLVPVVTNPTYPYLFVSGMIAICAMILPGISGAFVLLILGMYYHVTGVLKALASGVVSADNLATVVVFAAGCLTGLLAFSRLLRFLLERQHSVTMAVLCGFMFGSLRKIWPFKVEIDPAVAKDFKERVFENVWPWQSADGIFLPALMIVAGVALVLFLERVAGVGASRAEA